MKLSSIVLVTVPLAVAHPLLRLRHADKTPRAVRTLPRRAAFTLSNGQQAQQLNAKFASLDASSTCSDGEQACVGAAFAQCVGGKFQTQDCSGGTKCFALPLVNKAGTSITCDTEADAQARIAATGATGGLTGGGGSGQAAGNGTDTPSTTGSTSTGTDVADGSTGTSTAGTSGADTSADNTSGTDSAGTDTSSTGTSGDDNSGTSGKPCKHADGDSSTTSGTDAGTDTTTSTSDSTSSGDSDGSASSTGADAAQPTSAASQPASTGSSDNETAAAAGGFQLDNAKKAQALNASFKNLDAQSTCKDGDQACVGTQFAQCVGGKFEASACSSGTQCVALPLVNKPGTSITCDTEADAIDRMKAAGASASLTG